MRSRIQPNGQRRPSFIEAARRAQIVAAAIEMIATLGFAQASFARIADRAEISKGVISYHFAGKDDLIRAVVSEVFAAAQAFTRPRLAAESTAAGMLRACIESDVAFMRAYPTHLRALVEVFTNFRTAEGNLHYEGVSEEEPRLAEVEKILRTGQQSGEFREFSTRVMAVAITGALNAGLLQWGANPALDLEACARELVNLFDLGTRTIRAEASRTSNDARLPEAQGR